MTSKQCVLANYPASSWQKILNW